MKHALIINSIVIQVQPNTEDGFIEVPDSTVNGMVDNGDGTFSNPIPTQSELDAQIITAKWNELNIFLSNLTVQRAEALPITLGFKFSANPQSIANISLEIDTMIDTDTRTWYEDWGSQVVTRVELQEARRLASDAKQAKLTELFGA